MSARAKRMSCVEGWGVIDLVGCWGGGGGVGERGEGKDGGGGGGGFQKGDGPRICLCSCLSRINLPSGWLGRLCSCVARW